MIRNAEAQTSTGLTVNSDAALTDLGMKQAVITGVWLRHNMHLKGFKGFVAPELRTLQTASVISEITGVEFVVDSNLRDYRFDRSGGLRDGGINIENRSILFMNLQWPAKEWEKSSNFYSAETVEQFLERGNKTIKSYPEKALIISHASPIVLMSHMATGKDAVAIKNTVDETANFVASSSIKTVLGQLEKYVFLNGVRPCGITHVVDGEAKSFSRVVYQ